jgi:predicted nucleotidyltransferase
MKNLIMKCLFGSHLYGLNTPSSDKDYKGIYLPDKDGLLLGKYARHYSESTGNDQSKNTSDDVDVEIFSLPYFIELACKGETVAIDMLHAAALRGPVFKEYFGINHCYLNIWDEVKSRRKMFYTKDMKSYIGYARKQANKYGIKGSRVDAVEKVINYLKFNCSPEYRAFTTIRQVYSKLPLNEFVKHQEMHDSKNGTLRFYEICGRKYQDTLTLDQLLGHAQSIYNEYGDRAKMAKMDLGVDWKAVSHALRASYQMLGILKDGDFEYPLPQTDFLLAVKKGELNFVNEVQPELEEVIKTIEKLCEESKLPQKVDFRYWDNFLLNVYKEYL